MLLMMCSVEDLEGRAAHHDYAIAKTDRSFLVTPISLDPLFQNSRAGQQL